MFRINRCPPRARSVDRQRRLRFGSLELPARTPFALLTKRTVPSSSSRHHGARGVVCPGTTRAGALAVKVSMNTFLFLVNNKRTVLRAHRRIA
jgi:hypothetical protein